MMRCVNLLAITISCARCNLERSNNYKKGLIVKLIGTMSPPYNAPHSELIVAISLTMSLLMVAGLL